MYEFNEDELVPPTWLNKDFLNIVLRTYEKDKKIVISEFKISPGSAKGDHFSSILFRVVAKYSSSLSDQNERSMIVKSAPQEGGFKMDSIGKIPLFETEIGMYSEEVPKFEAILRKYGDNTQLCGKVLYHSLTPYKVIVFEDLVPLGYACIRDRYMNVDEVKICLSKIAKWHAVSYKLASEGDESVKKYKDGLLSNPKEDQPEFITAGLKHLVNAICKIKGLEMCAQKLQALEPSLVSKCNNIFKAHSRGAEGLMVLNHGDLHSRNVMFKLDADNKLKDVLFIDLQISCYAPAVIDVIFSIFMLFTEDLRKNHREEMIHYYFSIFLKTLKNIQFVGELPTLADFYIDLYRFKELEVWLMSTFLPLIYSIMSQAGAVPTEDLISSNDAQSLMYSNSDFLSEVQWLLPRLLHKGYFE